MDSRDIIERFGGVRIGVIGDAMLDTFLYGDVRRISPEAPVPVVVIRRQEHLPGGAANVAANITALGGRADLVSIIGSDVTGRTLMKTGRNHGISLKGVAIHRRRSTIQKTRVIGGGQHIVRMDREDTMPPDTATQRRFLQFIRRSIGSWDVVVVSDYAKGVITPTMAARIVALAKRHGKKVVADSKPELTPHLKGAYLFTPNHHEATALVGTKDIRRAGSVLQKRLRANILITQGIDGMTLFRDGRSVHIPAHSHTVFDVVGAGDTVVAACALSLGTGASLEDAARIANYAAGIVVGKRGTATVTQGELLASTAEILPRSRHSVS